MNRRLRNKEMGQSEPVDKSKMNKKLLRTFSPDQAVPERGRLEKVLTHLILRQFEEKHKIREKFHNFIFCLIRAHIQAQLNVLRQ